MLINVTDGDATDGDPEPVAQEIMALATNDGNVLIYNAHLSEMSAMPVQYPSEESEVPPDEYAARMFRMSSVFPDQVVELAVGMGPVGHPGFSWVRLQRRHGGPGAVPGHRDARSVRPALIR